MKSIKLIFILLVTTVFGTQDCGKADQTEQQLTTLSVDCFNSRYNHETHDGHKLARIISTKLATNRRILQHFKMHKIPHTQTTPVVKWAQTKQKIFINFKLSHRQDSPPCSDVRNQKFHILNVQQVEGKLPIQKSSNESHNFSRFDFQSECFFTSQKLMFKLNMTFSASLKSLSIDREGFGTYTLVGDKLNEQIWIDPFEDVHRAAIWPEMRERYSSAMNQYFQMREKRLQQSSQKGKKKWKKRPAAKSKKQPQQQL